MEENKDEAANCLEKAKKAFNEFEKNKRDKNKFEQAYKLARKSEKMYPSIDAKGFLLFLNAQEFTKGDNTNNNRANNESKSNKEVRANTTHNGAVPDNGKIYSILTSSPLIIFINYMICTLLKSAIRLIFINIKI